MTQLRHPETAAPGNFAAHVEAQLKAWAEMHPDRTQQYCCNPGKCPWHPCAEDPARAK